MIRSVLALLVGLLFTGPARTADPPKVADLVRQLETGSAGERVIAAERLGDLGPMAADAIPALTRTASKARRGSKEDTAEDQRANRHLYRAALKALVGIGPKSAPALVELLPGEKGELFGEAAAGLESFGRDAAPAVPALAKLLANDDQDFRVTVAGILEAIGPGAESAVPDLVALFQNPKNKDDNRFGTGPIAPPPRVAAVRALVRIGPKAAPALTGDVLRTVIDELKAGEYGSGGSPTEILSVLGEAGELAVPTVVATIRKGADRFDREDMGQALLGLGTAGRKAFAGLLADEDVAVRRVMVAALKSYLWHEYYPRYYHFKAPPLDITPLVPALLKELKDTEPKYRLAAAEVLSKRGDKVPASAVDAVIELFSDPTVKKFLEQDDVIHPDPDLAQFGEVGVRGLVALLDSDSPAVRKLAVGQLRYAPRQWAAAALPRLRELAKHSDPKLALDAAYTAATLSLDPKDAALLAAQRFVKHFDPEIRAAAANHINWLGPVGVPHLEALVPLLDDKDDKVVQAAAEAIYYHAPKGSAAARALADRKFVREPTLRFVRNPDAPAEPALPGVPELVRALTEGGDYQRVLTALDLGDRGAAAKAALPALKGLLTDPDPELRFATAYAVARIEGDRPALRQLLTAELERRDRGRPACWAAGVAFERLPPDFPELVPFVARWLAREPRGTVLIEGLRKYGPKAKDAVPALRKVLRGPEMPFHGYMAGELKPACEALGAIGPGARDALPDLRRVLDTARIEAALAARDAIRRIEAAK